MTVQYSQLIPQATQIELIQARDDITRSSWTIGKGCQDSIEYNLNNGVEFLMQDIYAAVGSFSGKASRTCRDYHSFWLFYPPEIQERFSILSFDHFVNAARIERAGGEKALVILEWAEAQVDQLNRPATVDAVIAKFGYPQEEGDSEPESDTEPEQDAQPEAVQKAEGRRVKTAFHIIRETFLQSSLSDEVVSHAVDLIAELETI